MVGVFAVVTERPLERADSVLVDVEHVLAGVGVRPELADLPPQRLVRPDAGPLPLEVPVRVGCPVVPYARPAVDDNGLAEHVAGLLGEQSRPDVAEAVVTSVEQGQLPHDRRVLPAERHVHRAAGDRATDRHRQHELEERAIAGVTVEG